MTVSMTGLNTVTCILNVSIKPIVQSVVVHIVIAECHSVAGPSVIVLSLVVLTTIVLVPLCLVSLC